MATQAASGMQTNLGFILDQVANEKGIDKEVLVQTVEAAILKAAQSVFGANRELETRFNEDTGQVDLYMYMMVVEEVEFDEREISLEDATARGLDAEVEDEIGFQIFWHVNDAAKAREQDKEYGDLLDMSQARKSFGRIAAQTAKQVLLARVREAERDIIYNDFKDREGQLIKGIVRRFEKGNNLIVDLGKTEGILPSREQTPRESYRPGDRIVALVKVLDREARGPQVILSRAAPTLVEKLFESEVPEIYEGIVRIMGVAREAGARSKIAVASRDVDVDPVGACVGMKGSRVQAVVQELRGEKIDIVPFDEDPAKYVIAAIQPAEVLKVIVDESDNRMELVVPDEKLSLAIGRKGQNVRLAAQLTGWKLDIVSESKFKQMEDEAISSLNGMGGVSEEVARSLSRAGFRSPEEVGDATAEELATLQAVPDMTAAEALKADSLAHMELKRQERLEAAKQSIEPLTDKDMLHLVKGVGPRSLTLLSEAGYANIIRMLEEDDERLSQRTGLGLSKISDIKDGAEEFLKQEHGEVEAAQAAAQRAALAQERSEGESEGEA